MAELRLRTPMDQEQRPVVEKDHVSEQLLA
jgi:hypothetical protein